MDASEQRRVRAAMGMLTPRKVVGFEKIRVGGRVDGGYVMLDDLASTGGLAYSLGVGPDVSWDLDMASRGWLVHQYDHTVPAPPARHESCTFHKVGIAGSDDAADMKRLDTLMRANGSTGRRDNILKIDIEGHEWASLSALPFGFFDHFRQVVAEVHWLDHLHSAEFQRTYLRVVGNLTALHQCIHVHANNYADFVVVAGVPIPPVLEITLVRKDLYDFSADAGMFPTPLDVVNDPQKPDLYLGAFGF